MNPRLGLATTFLALWFAGCGDDGGTAPDARPAPDADLTDAGPPELCINMTDTECGYTPEPVTPADVSLADQQTLAARFNPAMVYTGADVWAVSVGMLLAESETPLMRAEHDGRLNFSYDVDETTATVVDPQPADLSTLDMTTLPTTAPGGRGYVYWLDFPGTNQGNDYDQESWTGGWRAVQGTDHTTATYGPHQYAHFFWLDKGDRLLAIQYFFYYPFDKFTNNHEGDWEHVNVVLWYPESGAAAFVMAQFSFHGRQLGVAADRLYRTDDAGGDHLVVFVGGDACLNYVSECYCGAYSGASMPYPGHWELGYNEIVAGSAGNAGRAIAASEFEVELLPRLEDVDFATDTALSWYGTPFLVGEPTTEANAGAVISTDNHRSPVHPDPAHDEYDVGIEQTDATLELSFPVAFEAPNGWTFANEPPSDVFLTPPKNNNCVLP
jgi:hypothetical protein